MRAALEVVGKEITLSPHSETRALELIIVERSDDLVARNCAAVQPVISTEIVSKVSHLEDDELVLREAVIGSYVERHRLAATSTAHWVLVEASSRFVYDWEHWEMGASVICG